jgi:hypothetical protein
VPVLLLDPRVVPPANVGIFLDANHYLGRTARGVAWSDQHGVLVLAAPTSRRLPADRWFELTRWCLLGGANSGSRQWSAVRAWLLDAYPHVTTVVSYSDPSADHDGALYRACGWLWAPTWHRLRTPPTGQGRWQAGGKIEAAKDRWVDVLRADDDRLALLRPNDEAVNRRYPTAGFVEPDYRKGKPVRGTGGGDYQSWRGARA